MTSQARNYMDRLGMGMLVILGTPGGVMVSILAKNVGDVGSIPVLGAKSRIFITPNPHDTGFMTRILYNLHAVCKCKQ